MKFVWWVCFSVAISLVAFTQDTSAISVTDPHQPDPIENSVLRVSAVPFGPNPSFIELHNTSDKPYSIAGSSVTLVLKDNLAVSEVIISLPDMYLLADGYLALGQVGVVDDPDVAFSIADDMAEMSLYEVRLKDGKGREVVQLTDISSSSTKYIWAQRKGGKSGLGSTMSNMTQKDDPVLLRGKGGYQLPLQPPQIEIVEILPVHADCAPNDTSLTCGDYIKLHNSSDVELDLSLYRLRTDSGSSESGNAFSLGYLVPPGEYLTVYLRDDDEPMSITNDGGYVWLEDIEGIVRYKNTITSYEDASSATKKGWAWAKYETGKWGWTSTPQPDAPNLITLPQEKAKVLSVTAPAPCPEGKYRHPETNRCRNIIMTTVSLTPCDPGEYRHPDTNRCRKTVTAGATLTPCGPGQKRNPATNRCRKIVEASATLAPCPAGQERNPATNRCRKVTSSQVAASILSEPAETPSTPYWIGGAVVAAVVTYGVYEWRHELAKLFRKLMPSGK